MKVTIITFCLIGAVFANPISYNVISQSSELNSNTTESLSLSQSSENDTSEPQQSSEENTSNQSSESESLETTSEDKTSEESNSESDEDNQVSQDFISETRDNSMSSEENVRKNLVPVYASVANVLSAEDNSSTEVKGQSDLSKEPVSPTFKQKATTLEGQTNLQLVETPTDSSDTTSESADSTDIITPTTSDSSDSTSSESNETSETSDDSKSTEDSNASDSSELVQLQTNDCVNGTQSCESDEHFFQNVGDDAHHSVDSVDNLMVPDEEERELSLRR